MICVIYGRKGSGKTKRIIDMANIASRENEGDLVFIDDDNRYMFDLRHEIRFINAGEYDVHNAQTFIGFVCGLLAQNFDIHLVFVDAFLKLVREEVGALQWLFERLKAVSERHNVRFVISCNGDAGGPPEYLKSYII